MAIFVYDEKLKKTVPLEEYNGNKDLKRNRCDVYVNMRNTWSGTTKMEFRESTVGESIKNMGGDLNG